MGKLDLADYFVSVTPKTQLMIYLIAAGELTFSEVGRMTARELHKWRSTINTECPELLDMCDELCTDEKTDKPVFTNTSGRLYSVKNITDILTRVHNIAGKEYEGRKAFIQRVRKKSGKKSS